MFKVGDLVVIKRIRPGSVSDPQMFESYIGVQASIIDFGEKVETYKLDIKELDYAWWYPDELELVKFDDLFE